MEFIYYFDNVFTFTNLLILVLGTIGGLLMGAAPGLSPTMAVALLIPFTFRMLPEQGLIMLGAVYTATVAGVVVKNKMLLKSEDLILHCKKHLGDFKAPSKIHFLDELPKGPSGKIQRFKIKELI